MRAEINVTMLDVAIVGSGFAGIGMAIALHREGKHSFAIFERASDLGGTWRDNAYPGCACDIPSMLYSFSFERGTGWSRRYPPQQEIWAYLRHCARKYGAAEAIRYNADIVEARWDEAASLWRLQTRSGDIIEARVVVFALGGLSNPAIPKIPGLERFTGAAFHSATWDHSIDLNGKRIAVIGTGASAIQFIPKLAERAGHLTVFQRTPPWIVPRGDAPVSRFKQWLRGHIPGYSWLVRKAIYWTLELRAYAFTVDPRVLRFNERFGLKHLHSQVPEPDLRRKLTPDYRMGCKRVLLSDDYYPALRRPNVTLETSAIAEVRERSIVTMDGTEHPTDAIVFGTGFRAQEFVTPVRVIGRNGIALDRAWHDGPKTYLGINTAGFPNLFFLVGPNTGLGHNSMVLMIEAQIRYVMSALRTMRKQHLTALDVREETQTRFQRGLAKRNAQTVWSSGCRSWYLDSSGRNTALWPGFTFAYRFLTRRLNLSNYTATSQ